MSDVTLSAAVRSSLLSLQKTTELIERTQNRLSTGLKVASAIDDPVAFFQAKSLTDRANDFTQKKDGIDQGISSVTAALDAVEAIEAITQQLKGLAQSLKSSTGTQFTDLITQFNNLRSQIGTLTADATYQGTNLVNGTGTTLSIEFSEKTASLLTINSVDLKQTGLGIQAAARYSGGDSLVEVNYASRAAVTVAANSAGSTAIQQSGILTSYFTFTYRGPDETFTTASTFQINYGTGVLTLAVSTGGSQAITQGRVFALGAVTAAVHGTVIGTGLGSALIGTQGTFQLAQLGVLLTAIVQSTAASAVNATVAAVTDNQTNYVSETDTTQINEMISELDSALTTLRTNASTLGSNVALLSTRLDFTNEYVNTLTTGSSKLTLADINEEGANLLALQTRQQLGISALSFAGQAEQSILALFR
jgi:flagellin-like hook-associated protein FlgL